MYGQMTAGSWIYIGSQGIVQGTYETFRRNGPPALRRGPRGGGPDGGPRRHGRRATAGRHHGRRVHAGGGMPAHRIRKRLETRYLDVGVESLDEALARIEEAGAARWRDQCRPARQCRRGAARTAASAVRPTRSRRDVRGRPRSTATSPSGGRSRNGPRARAAIRVRRSRRRRLDGRSRRGDAGLPEARHSRVRLRQQYPAGRADAGVPDAFAFPGFVPAYVRPLFCLGVGPFRWAALSGNPEDILRTDARVKELIPDDPHLHRWADMAHERIQFQGLPARICWVGLGQRHRLDSCSTRWSPW